MTKRERFLSIQCKSWSHHRVKGEDRIFDATCLQDLIKPREPRTVPEKIEQLLRGKDGMTIRAISSELDMSIVTARTGVQVVKGIRKTKCYPKIYSLGGCD